MIKVRTALVLIALLTIQGCGTGGMTRAMQPVVDGFERGERVSQDIRQKKDE